MAKKNDFLQGINPNIALIGGVAALAYFGVLNPILKALGIKDDAATAAQKAAEESALITTLAATQKTQKQTRTDADLSSYAEIIHQALKYSSLDDDKEKAGLYLCMVNNDVDVLKLIKFFGRREEAYFGVFTYTRTLAEFVASNLSAGKVALINANYARKGIKFRW